MQDTKQELRHCGELNAAIYNLLSHYDGTQTLALTLSLSSLVPTATVRLLEEYDTGYDSPSTLATVTVNPDSKSGVYHIERGKDFLITEDAAEAMAYTLKNN